MAFRRLGADFNGQTVAGVGFDRDTLLEAGIEKAGAFAAVSSGDNSNIIAARLARESFGVANVVARIYDPARAEIYQRLGIQTVATVLWTTDQILRRLLPEGAKSEWSDPSGNVQLCEMPVHRDWFGQSIGSIQEMTSARVAFITRLGEGIVPLDRTILQEGDVLHIFVEIRRSQRWPRPWPDLRRRNDEGRYRWRGKCRQSNRSRVDQQWSSGAAYRQRPESAKNGERAHSGMASR